MENCLFCKIVKGQIPAARVYEDDSVVVIKDINPQAPVHLLAITREHYAGIHEVPLTNKSFFDDLMKAVGEVVKKENLLANGYRLVVNFGENAGQAVDHIHVHILGGRTMHWPPG